jgi:hypothetical protein
MSAIIQGCPCPRSCAGTLSRMAVPATWPSDLSNFPAKTLALAGFGEGLGHTSSPIDLINASPLLFVTTPARSL